MPLKSKRILRAVRKNLPVLPGSLLYAFLSQGFFEKYAKSKSPIALFVSIVMGVFFLWTCAFLIGNILRESREA